MKTVLILFGILLSVQACKHADCKPAITTPSIQIVNSVGSYWIYNWYSIDTLGNEKLIQTDSIYIAEDTIINNNTYTIRQGEYLNGGRTEYIRDSLGYIVNAKGDILWNKNSSGTFRILNTSTLNLEWTMTSLDSKITVPAGSFTVMERTTKACYPDGQQMTPCDQCQEAQAYYSDGIGIVLDRTAYIGNIDCSYLEGRLTKYLVL